MRKFGQKIARSVSHWFLNHGGLGGKILGASVVQMSSLNQGPHRSKQGNNSQLLRNLVKDFLFRLQFPFAGELLSEGGHPLTRGAPSFSKDLGCLLLLGGRTRKQVTWRKW